MYAAKNTAKNRRSILMKSEKVGLACRCQASMPHSTVGVNNPGRYDDFLNRKIDVVCVAYAYSNSTEPSKCAMHL